MYIIVTNRQDIIPNIKASDDIIVCLTNYEFKTYDNLRIDEGIYIHTKDLNEDLYESLACYNEQITYYYFDDEQAPSFNMSNNPPKIIKLSEAKINKFDIDYSKKYSKEKLREFYYHIMNDNETQKIIELNAGNMIRRIIKDRSYQIKYIENVGYIFIGESYVILENCFRQKYYTITHLFNNAKDARKEIEIEYNKELLRE